MEMIRDPEIYQQFLRSFQASSSWNPNGEGTRSATAPSERWERGSVLPHGCVAREPSK